MVVGIVAAILLVVGLLPPYGEIWKRRGRVIGINWVGNPHRPTPCDGQLTFFGTGVSHDGLVRGILLPHGTR